MPSIWPPTPTSRVTLPHEPSSVTLGQHPVYRWSLFGTMAEVADITESSRLSLIPISLSSLTISSMSSSSADSNSGTGTPSGRPRGRRAAIRVPCDECIQRASENKQGNIELCDKCTAVLHRPRRAAQKETANPRKVRRQSHAIIDTALGIRTENPTLPWSSDRQEQHALQFFIKHSAPQLAGYFDSPLWQKMV